MKKLMLVLVLSLPCFAAEIHWVGGEEIQNLNDPNNWNPPQVPINSDDVIFDGNVPTLKKENFGWNSISVLNGKYLKILFCRISLKDFIVDNIFSRVRIEDSYIGIVNNLILGQYCTLIAAPVSTIDVDTILNDGVISCEQTGECGIIRYNLRTGSGIESVVLIPKNMNIADLNGDGIVNMKDFAVFSENWMKE